MEKINQLIRDGYITTRTHPNGKLVIYNYTAKAQYEKMWTPETTESRGLIRNLNR